MSCHKKTSPALVGKNYKLTILERHCVTYDEKEKVALAEECMATTVAAYSTPYSDTMTLSLWQLSVAYLIERELFVVNVKGNCILLLIPTLRLAEVVFP